MRENNKKKIIIISIILIVILVAIIPIIFFLSNSMNRVKLKIKDQYFITEGNHNIVPHVKGCKITLENEKNLERITRTSEDTEIDLTFNVKCGNKEEKIKAKAVIKKSPYTYEATANENLQNYDLIIKENNKAINKTGNVYDLEGSWLSEIIDGKAIINNMDIKDYPDFKVVFEDKNTIFVINKK